MDFSLLTENLPFIAVAVGALLLLWVQRDKIMAFLGSAMPLKLKLPDPYPDSLSPSELFDTFYALRSWCVNAGYRSAVIALDDEVLPSIVRTEGPIEDDSYIIERNEKLAP